jgi:hypothetical protein
MMEAMGIDWEENDVADENEMALIHALQEIQGTG